MKTLVFVFVLLLSRIAIGQHQDIRWGITNGPIYLPFGLGQVDLEYFIKKRNSVLIGLGYQNNTLTIDDPLYINGYSEDGFFDGLKYEKGVVEGFKVDLLHKYYFPLTKDIIYNYHSLFLMHGPTFHFHEHEYLVEVWDQNEQGSLVLKEGSIYDYITNLGYTFGVGMQMLTNNKKFSIELYSGIKYQHSWIDKSPFSEEDYDDLTINSGRTGFLPEVLIKIGIYFLKKV